MKPTIWILNHYATDMFKNRGGRHYWFAENLIKQGYSVTIFCANTYHNKTEFIDTNGKKYVVDSTDNIPFVFIKTNTALGNGISRIKNMFLFYKNLLSITKGSLGSFGEPDVILASSVHPLTMVAGIQIAKRFGVPCICEVRDLWPEAIFSFKKVREKSIFGRVLTAGEHWIYKKADAIIFTKEGDIDYIKEKKWDQGQGGDIDLGKCHYINNGVDLRLFETLSHNNDFTEPEWMPSSDMFNVVYIGSIRPVNNVGNILDAAVILGDQEQIQILIYGEGNQLDMLKQRVSSERLTNVKLMGHVSKRNLPYILQKSSVNLLNYSSTEYNWARGNSSNKLFEYMASGKPIISTVKMGYSIIDKYKCGIELERSTPHDLANAIIKVKNMSNEQYESMGNNAKAGAKDFDFKVLTEKLIGVIESVHSSISHGSARSLNIRQRLF